MNRIPGGTRIRVNGYVNFTAAPEKPKVEENTLADQLKAAKSNSVGDKWMMMFQLVKTDGYESI